MEYHQIKSKGLQGVDVSKEITLKEYGFGYHILPRKGIYRFYIADDVSIENDQYFWWDALELPLDVKIEDEFNFIDVEEVANSMGIDPASWLSLSAPEKLYRAIVHYGVGNF
jgi:hypothetical protein